MSVKSFGAYSAPEGCHRRRRAGVPTLCVAAIALLATGRALHPEKYPQTLRDCSGDEKATLTCEDYTCTFIGEWKRCPVGAYSYGFSCYRCSLKKVQYCSGDEKATLTCGKLTCTFIGEPPCPPGASSYGLSCYQCSNSKVGRKLNKVGRKLDRVENAPNKTGTSKAAIATAGGEAEAWKRATAHDELQAYIDFHKAYPNSKLLTVLTADVDFGSARGGIEIKVKGHRQLDGSYSTEQALQLGMGTKVNADGNVVMPNGLIKDVELYITQIGGEPRILATKLPVDSSLH
jgi:hypothetical protein